MRKTPTKRRISVLLTRELEEKFDAYRAKHTYWSDSAIGVHLIALGFLALENDLDLDWHKPPQVKVNDVHILPD